MVEVDGEYYYLDIDSINDWIFSNPNDKKTLEKTKTSNGVDEQTAIIESDEKEQYANVRYSIVSEMLHILYSAGVTQEQTGEITAVGSLSDLTIGEGIVFNSFMQKKFIKNKLDKK